MLICPHSFKIERFASIKNLPCQWMRAADDEEMHIVRRDGFVAPGIDSQTPTDYKWSSVMQEQYMGSNSAIESQWREPQF